MKVFRYRLTDTNGTPRSAFSSQFRSLKACLKAVAQYRAEYNGAFNRPDDRIEIKEFTK